MREATREDARKACDEVRASLAASVRLSDYRVNGIYAAAVLRSLARQAKSDAALGYGAEQLTEAQRSALRKVSRLATEARRILETS